MIATARKRLSGTQAATLEPGRSLHLTTDLNVGPHRAAARLDPGTYTVEVKDGGFTAATTIQIGGS